MPEKINVPKQKEGRESTNRPPRYRTIERIVLGGDEDGSTTERWTECNGLTHRGSLQKISPGKNGEFDYVEELSRTDLGPCRGNHS